MENRKETRQSFANYLREHIETPPDWNTQLFGEFPGTVSMFQKYFTYILEQNTNKAKINTIEAHYNLHKYESLEKKSEVIDGRPRSIEKFFKENTLPYEKNLDFIALVFDAPISSLEEFAAQEKQKKAKKEAIPPGAQEKQKKAEKEAIPSRSPNERRPFKALFRENKAAAFATALLVLSALLFFAIHTPKNTTLHAENLLPATDTATRQSASFFPTDIGKQLFVRTIKTGTQTTDTLAFHTINIFNDQCVYKQTGWSFETDPKGEDMNSEYGTPFNEDIHLLYPTVVGRTTLPNQFMDIHFNIENNTQQKLLFSAFNVKIIDSYHAQAEGASYNLYQARGNELRFEIELNGQTSYPYTTEKEPVGPGESLFCRLRINGNDQCDGLIYNFIIVCDLVDTQGNHYRVESDKSYFIAFVAP